MYCGACVCMCVCAEQDISVTVYGLFQQDESLYKQLSKGLLAILKYSESTIVLAPGSIRAEL